MSEQSLPRGATHELKCWPPYFEAILSGRKTFEVRENDRNFWAGDLLRLREFSPGGEGTPHGYTGRELTRRVTYVLDGNQFGIATGYVVIALEADLPKIIDQARQSERERVREALEEKWPKLASDEFKNGFDDALKCLEALDTLKEETPDA